MREESASGRYHTPKRVYNEMYRIFGSIPRPISTPELIVTEDSNSGYEFFSVLFPDRCTSSNGKSNIKRVIAGHSGQSIIAVVDGAAFGPEMQDCMDIVSDASGGAVLYAPESFEYLILQSGIIEVPKAILDETWNHADSVKYFSWEEYYTDYLSDATRNSVGQYSKSKLSEFYKTAGNLEKLKSVLPEYIRDSIEG